MGEPTAFSAAVTMLLLALGVQLAPEEYVTSCALGCGIGYAIRAIAPRDSRSEILMVPIAGVLGSTIALMAHPWLIPSAPPVLIGVIVGGSGVPILRFWQKFSYRMPAHAEKISDGITGKISGDRNG